MSRIYRTRTFSRWMRKTALADNDLIHSIDEMKHGLIDADLGGGILKKRISLAGRGKRGGARVLIATRMSDDWFYLYGFLKNERNTITEQELKFLQEVAQDLFSLSEKQIALAVEAGELTEIYHDDKDET